MIPDKPRGMLQQNYNNISAKPRKQKHYKTIELFEN